jgi:hypothetical protein
VAIS